MDVLVLIDRLEELVEEARSFPGFGNTAMIDRDAAFDIIDQMRQTIPEELKQARWIVKERQAMLDEARSESDRIIRGAQDEAEKITSEEEVLKDRKSTRLNSIHANISYAVFCLKKKNPLHAPLLT